MVATRDLRVDYGDVVAVAGLDLRVPRGVVYGMIGPNGAGKTSTIRVLAGLMLPTYGEVMIDGIDVMLEPERIQASIGYMPDLAPVYTDLKCWEFLDLFAHAYGLDEKTRKTRVETCLHDVGLVEKRNMLAGTLSRGMTQRLVLAKTLLHDPKLLLLDEPASGLDPAARINVRNTLRQLASAGRTIIVSSHILTELSDICHHVGVMERGEMVYQGAIGDVLGSKGGGLLVEVRVLKDRAGLAQWLTSQEYVANITEQSGNDEFVQFTFAGTREQLPALLSNMLAEGFAVSGFQEKRLNLEELFLSLNAGRTA